MNEICIKILREKLKELQEVAADLNNAAISAALRDFEEAVKASEKTQSGDISE